MKQQTSLKMPVVSKTVGFHTNTHVMKQTCILASQTKIILTSLFPAQQEKSCFGRFTLLPKQSTHTHIRIRLCLAQNASDVKCFQRRRLDLLQCWMDSDRKSSGCAHISVRTWAFQAVRRDWAHVYCRLIMQDKPAAFLCFSNQVSLQTNPFKSNVTWRRIILNPSSSTTHAGVFTDPWWDFVGVCRPWLIEISLTSLLVNTCDTILTEL